MFDGGNGPPGGHRAVDLREKLLGFPGGVEGSKNTMARATKAETERTRKNRVRRLFLRDGLDGLEIADRLLEDGDLTCSLRRARQLVREDVAELRAELEANRVDQDDEDAKRLAADGVPWSLIRKYERARHAYQRACEIAEDESFVTVEWSNGAQSGTTQKPKWPPSVKASAIVEMRQGAKLLAEIEEEVERIRGRGKDAAEGDSHEGRLVVIAGDESLDDLIQQVNFRPSEVN